MSRPILRRSTGAAALLTVALSGLPVLAAAPGRAAAPESPAERATADVTGASFTWGVSGYAQKGVFAPWTIAEPTGDVTVLDGDTQTEYVVEPVPATSMPADAGTENPTAVQFTGGTGTADPATGEATLTWTGSYRVNAYPVAFGAPSEYYSDPQLTVGADGAGELTMEITIGEGTDIDGDPTSEVDLGRVPVMTFTAGSVERTAGDAFRLTPDYQGVEVEGVDQERSCTTEGGATGWWGAWPAEYVAAMPDSVRPHFYSTGCGGLQDNKPALPADVDLELAPEIAVSQSTVPSTGETEVTVTGSNFDPQAAIGTRPPLAGQPAGTYVAFGRFAETWRPSEGAASGTRPSSSVQWATPGGTAPGTAALEEDGSFTTTLVLDQAAADEAAGELEGSYGIYTYAGSGAVVAAYETFTPITFALQTPTVRLAAPRRAFGQRSVVTATVAHAVGSEGTVTFTSGGTELGTTSVDGGSASLDLGTLQAGRYPVTAAYSGNEGTEPGTATATHTVAKASSRLVVNAKRPRQRKAGRVVAKVASPTTSATGTVRVVLRRPGAANIKKNLTLNARGKVATNLGKVRKGGKYVLVVSYRGTANIAATPAVRTVWKVKGA